MKIVFDANKPIASQVVKVCLSLLVLALVFIAVFEAVTHRYFKLGPLEIGKIDTIYKIDSVNVQTGFGFHAPMTGSQIYNNSTVFQKGNDDDYVKMGRDSLTLKTHVSERIIMDAMQKYRDKKMPIDFVPMGLANMDMDQVKNEMIAILKRNGYDSINDFFHVKHPTISFYPHYIPELKRLQMELTPEN